MAQTQVVIVDQTHSIDPALLHNAAIALNIQVTQHLTKHWPGIVAGVSAAPKLGSVPTGAWPVFLVKSLPPGEGGFHQDKNKQPYAKVIASASDASWTVDASHEIVEMLVDPFGNRMQSSQAIAIEGDDIVDAAGQFNYLVEACDPCEANNYAYDINGIAVSDFITPHFYDSTKAANTSYSYTGSLTRPRQMLKGGYISFINADHEWQQILWVDPNQPPQLKGLGPADAGLSLREGIHLAMGDALTKAKHLQRRKTGGLKKEVQARVTQAAARFGAAEAHEEHLKALYKLD